MKKIIILTLCFALVLLTQVQVAYPQVEPIGGVPVHTISGSNAPTFPKANGSIWDSVSDGNGGWYIGGSFATVGGQNIANLAHILSNGTVDTSFNLNPNGSVEALALSGSILYVGGDFSTIGGQARNKLASIDTTIGTVTAWNPNVSGSTIKDIAVSGTTVFIGGGFNTVGGQSRKNVAGVNATSGNPTNLSADFNDTVFALAVSGNTLYVGGYFTTPRTRLASFDIATESLKSWSPDLHFVYALAVSGSNLYVGGIFTSINGQARNRLASFDIATETLTNWNPNSNSVVRSLAANGTTIFAGGEFTTIGGQSRNRLANIDATTGSVTSWNHTLDPIYIQTLSVSGSYIYAGGRITDPTPTSSSSSSSSSSGSTSSTSSSSSSSSSSSGSTFSDPSSITIQTNSNSSDTCTLVSGTSIYSLMSIQITAKTSNFNPGPDDVATVGVTTGNARATNMGRISQDSDVIGNIFSFIPPTGAKFVILPGFENTLNSTLLSNLNATINNAFSQDSTNGNSDSSLGISVGIVNSDTAGAGRAIVAIARDADDPSGLRAGSETYPKSGTGNNTAVITINGLGIRFDSGQPISGSLQAIFDGIPPNGIGKSGGYLISGQSSLVASALPGLSNTPLNICTFRATLSSSSSSGSLSNSSSSSSSGLISSTSSSSSGSITNENCPICLVSGSQCPTSCPEAIINCGGVAYLNICDYQKIKCGCNASTNTSSSGGEISTLQLNPAFSGVWKGITKVISSSGKKQSKLAVLKLCISDGELGGTVDVAGVINGGEILSQDVKSESEVDIDILDRNEDINSISLKLINNRQLSITIENNVSFLARKTKLIKQCLQSLRKKS